MDVAGELIDRLKKGGDKGIDTFMVFAAEMYKKDGQNGLMGCVLAGWKYLPQDDQEILLATGLEALLNQRGINYPQS